VDAMEVRVVQRPREDALGSAAGREHHHDQQDADRQHGQRERAHTRALRCHGTHANPSGPEGATRSGQYAGWLGSILSTQAGTPPPTWIASEYPAPLTTASASAERMPVLQYRTTCLPESTPGSRPR